MTVKTFKYNVLIVAVIFMVSCSKSIVHPWGDSINKYVQEQYMPAEKYHWDWAPATYMRAVADRYEYGIDRDASLQYIRTAMDVNMDNASGIHPNHAVSGFGMAMLARITKEEKYLMKALAIYEQYTRIPRAGNGGVSHRDDVIELWDDTVYMISLFLQEMYRLTGDEKHLEELVFQIKAHAEVLEDPATGLWYHGWDNDTISTDDKCCQLGWADNPLRRNAEFWGRGNGWVAMTLANTLHLMPNMEGRKDLLDMYSRMMHTLARLQDPATGHWRQLPLHTGDADNFIESSCTAMFAYAMAVGICDGLLPEATFRPIVDAAYRGIEQHSLKKVDIYYSIPGRPESGTVDANTKDWTTVKNVCYGTCIGDRNYYYARQVVEDTHFALGAAMMFYDRYHLMLKGK